ncbi:hypothetical protein TraAM80_06459 [Trypanosoma rangeli]|uniref:Uncharacterized protein n=1 Tax=Trypanosoma rangeli TaxID=5698 RepID=A0A3R7K619_TRYRA|nr:uncharacterized protein TraAM80_06459 [Trypanosoma rangeli]RNF02323.1 hypothetical protein TraAM80_06459 [Trypanosoma rangeli]|eukprot:RNF02323.1 hypothetical protein TraAM80_06459 [Trypanosoma rangeli]
MSFMSVSHLPQNYRHNWPFFFLFVWFFCRHSSLDIFSASRRPQQQHYNKWCGRQKTGKMEDDIVRGRCAAVVQQLLYSGEKRTVRREDQQRLIGAAAEELRQRAMLIYRLCRAKHEKLASHQTEDAAYCVLAATSSCQPSLWAVLTNWSRALRPRAPELRFGAPVLVTVRLREVEQFITRGLHLLPASSAEDACPPAKGGSATSTCASLMRGGTRKHPREGEHTPAGNLEPELATQLAFDYFQLNVTNSKKFYAVVAAYQKELGVKLLDNREGSAPTRMVTLCGSRNSRHGVLDGDGISVSSHDNICYAGGGSLPEEEEEGDVGEYSLLFPPALSSSVTFGDAFSVTSLRSFTSSMSLIAVADKVEAACSTLFFERLQRCLRNPLLYSPLATMREANASVFGVAQHHPLPESQLEAAYLRACQGAMVGNGGLLAFPTHFLHPLRAHPTSLMPLPLQMVTVQQLWRRLLVAGLWLHVVGTEMGDAHTQPEVGAYCITIVGASRRELCCSVCDTLVRENPVLRLSALAHEVETRDDNQPIRSWEEMMSMALPTSTANGSLCDELLRCLSQRLEQKVREQSGCDSSTLSCTSTTVSAAANTKRGSRASYLARSPSSNTLLELLMDVEGEYPLPACRAALLGKPEGETALRQLLSAASTEADKATSTHHPDAAATMSQEVKELLDTVPCIPRLRDVDGVLECAACLQQFHQGCVCPLQREPAEGIFLCHACRLTRGPQLLPPLRCSFITNGGTTAA